MATKTRCLPFRSVFLSQLLLFSQLTGGFLDFEELQSTNYEIDILDTPVDSSEVNVNNEILKMAYITYNLNLNNKPTHDHNGRELATLESSVTKMDKCSNN